MGSHSIPLDGNNVLSKNPLRPAVGGMCLMRRDALFRLFQAVTGDLLQKPEHCRQMLHHYLDLRSLTGGAGRLLSSSIFELLPKAAETPVYRQDKSRTNDGS